MLIQRTEQTDHHAMQTRSLKIKEDKNEIELRIGVMLTMGITEIP